MAFRSGDGVAINEAGLALSRLPWYSICRDWTVAAKGPQNFPAIRGQFVAQGTWARTRDGCGWMHSHSTRNLYYFDDKRVLGQDVPSSIAGRNLGVGTATAALQLLAEAGVREVYLNGFDAFWGGTIEYGEPFLEMGLSHDDYAERFPASGTPDEQATLVRESMRYVIQKKGLTVKPCP